MGLKQIVALVEIEKMKYKVDVFLNLDHAKDLDIIKKAIDYGFSAVHFDYSSPSLEKNIKSGKLTKSNINNRGYNKYLQLKGEVEVNIDYEKFDKDKAWDSL